MDIYIHFFTLTLALAILLTDAEDFCNWETFKAKCPFHEVIKIDMAKYGRIAHGRCIEKDFGYVGCSANVVPVAEQMCNGRHDCSITVPNEHMDYVRKSKCPSDLIGYLTISYSCMKVAKPNFDSCDIHPTSGSNSPPFIASASSPSTGCGQNNKPWRIKVLKGQKINLTLHDFNSSYSGLAIGHSTSSVVYATVKDVSAGTSRSVNGGRGRISHVYLSQGPELEIRILSGTGTQLRYFLLEYKVVGCPEIPLPTGGWVEYLGAEAIVRCNDNSATWRLKCNVHEWKGDYGACGGEIILSPSKNRNNAFRVNMPWSVIIVVCVAILLGLAILATGVCVLKRRKNHPYASAGPRGQHPNQLKDFPPDYNTAQPPPSYYSARNLTPDHEYEYVSDVLQRKEPGTTTTMHPYPILPAGGNISMASEITNYTGTGYGTLPAPPNAQAVKKSGGVTGNVYVPDNISLMSPKYFELDPSQGGRARQAGGSNMYNSLHQCAQVSKQQFGHYSQ